MASIPLMYAQEDCELGGKESIEVSYRINFRKWRLNSRIWPSIFAQGFVFKMSTVVTFLELSFNNQLVLKTICLM